MECRKPLLITIPHSGEKVPPETPWLKALPETILMYDIDRYVDRLYDPVVRRLGIPTVKTEWHRYAVDLNRGEQDIDSESVAGEALPAGKFFRGRGLHWVVTTGGERVLPEPISRALHDELVAKYFAPFHIETLARLAELRQLGAKTTYHIDAHSMPSVGTKEHRDPGELRKDIVVSDCSRKSCSPFFKNLVMKAFKDAGFSVAYNWPYLGGRVSEVYGRPEDGQEAIQVELNRKLYMNESTKHLTDARLPGVQQQLAQAIEAVHAELPDF